MNLDEIVVPGAILAVIGAGMIARLATRGTQSAKVTVLAVGGVLVAVIAGLFFLGWLYLVYTLEGPGSAHFARSQSSGVSTVQIATPTVAAPPKAVAAPAAAPSPAPPPPAAPKPAKQSESKIEAKVKPAAAVRPNQEKTKIQNVKLSTPIGPPPPAASAKRPDWIDAPAGRVGDGLGVYQMCLMVGPYTTTMECEQELPAQLARAVRDYADLYLGSESHGRIPLDLQARVGASATAVKDLIVRDVFHEEIQTSLGPMKQMHVRIELNSTFNDWLKSQWREVQVHRRLGYAGVGVIGVLGVLSIAMFSSKIDLATGGRYRTRVGVVAGLLMMALGCTLLMAFYFGTAMFF